jgi:HD-GYP domain-containing protein (c-di-GMP phosphodiesterase class II)
VREAETAVECLLTGAGFPDGRDRNRVSWAARIVAVADPFDAMTTDRC